MPIKNILRSRTDESKPAAAEVMVFNAGGKKIKLTDRDIAARAAKQSQAAEAESVSPIGMKPRETSKQIFKGLGVAAVATLASAVSVADMKHRSAEAPSPTTPAPADIVDTVNWGTPSALGQGPQTKLVFQPGESAPTMAERDVYPQDLNSTNTLRDNVIARIHQQQPNPQPGDEAFLPRAIVKSDAPDKPIVFKYGPQ
jgi:hypothetical protein